MAKFIIFRKIVDDEKILINIDCIRSMEPVSKLYNGGMVDCTDIYYLDDRVTVLSTIDEIHDIIEGDWETNVWDTTGDSGEESGGDDSGDDSGDDEEYTWIYGWFGLEQPRPSDGWVSISAPIDAYISWDDNDRPEGWSYDNRNYLGSFVWRTDQNNISEDAESVFVYGRLYGSGQWRGDNDPGLGSAEFFIYPDLESASNAYYSDNTINDTWIFGLQPAEVRFNIITRIQ